MKLPASDGMNAIPATSISMESSVGRRAINDEVSSLNESLLLD